MRFDVHGCLKWLRRGRRGDAARGATAPEYALGISLLVMASLGAISFLEDGSSDAVADRGNAIGTPDLDEAFGSSTTSSAPTSTSSSTTTTAPPVPPVVAITSALNPHNGHNCGNANFWTPTVIVTVTDDTGHLVRNASVNVTWVKSPSNETITASFATKQDGTATFSLHNLSAQPGPTYVSSVTFTVDSVTPDGGSPSTPNPPLTQTINEEPCL